VHQQAFTALALAFGLSVVLSSASCVTCPDGQQSCGNSNPVRESEAGAGNEHETSCDLLKAMRQCMDDFCKTASNPFCTCYKRGFNINVRDCPKCVDWNTKNICALEENGLDAASYDCAADSSAVSSYCVPVN